ncbi:MAG: 16S rRNA (guanine(966)-N(2))-methyltransferase RsmD [Geminicoccaceae bacterium]|nr:MAG: 16S rRNA (guanine(966)-N(2))-methyltransferase RsmD [Geminicoccaceae bacterium]
MVLRVQGGRFKGTVLQTPPDATFRPTSARRRQAVFDILRAHLDGFEGVRFADVFAGTGAVGIEALSEGVAHVIFIENDPTAAGLIRRNVAGLDLGRQVTLLRNDATRLGTATAPVEVAFLDPPYGQNLAERALCRLVEGRWLTADAVVLVELGKADPFDPPPGLAIERTHTHGAGRLVRLGLVT